MDDAPVHVTAENAEEWHAWLEANHRLGWIDSLARSLDYAAVDAKAQPKS